MSSLLDFINSQDFSSPIRNRVLDLDPSLMCMIVLGENSRNDFHYESGEEFFLQLEGDLELELLLSDRRVTVRLKKNFVYLLAPRVFHSPQRRNPGLGLVVERPRVFDALEFDSDKTRFTRYFHVLDLEKDFCRITEEYERFRETGEGMSDPPLEREEPYSIDGFDILEFAKTLKTSQRIFFESKDYEIWLILPKEGKVRLHKMVYCIRGECSTLNPGQLPVFFENPVEWNCSKDAVFLQIARVQNFRLAI